MMRFYLRFGFLTGHTQYLSGEGKSRVLCTLFYLVIHITLYDEFAKQVREMLNIMKLPVKWW